MPITDVEGKARALFEARRDRRPIEPFTDADPTLGMADGYAVQAALTRMILDAGDSIVGYKVGLTSEAMQKMIGVDSPTTVRCSRRRSTATATSSRWTASSRRSSRPRSCS